MCDKGDGDGVGENELDEDDDENDELVVDDGDKFDEADVAATAAAVAVAAVDDDDDDDDVAVVASSPDDTLPLDSASIRVTTIADGACGFDATDMLRLWLGLRAGLSCCCCCC